MISNKATIICLYEILKKYSDEYHTISVEMIQKKLESNYQISMERRTVYRNIEALRSMGIEVAQFSRKDGGYYLIDRSLELYEVRLLCDAIASSDLFDKDMGKKTIQKLISTQSIYQGRSIQRTVYVKEKIKSYNKQLFYNIDLLNMAISQGCKIKLQCLHMGYENELEPDDNGLLIFNPLVTAWAKGHYYILGSKSDEERITHLRIDRVRDIELLDESIELVTAGFNPTQYVEKNIYRNGENVKWFELDCEESLWEMLVEQFGDGLQVLRKPYGREQLRVKVRSCHSEMKEFVLAHMDACSIVAPLDLRKEVGEYVHAAYGRYWDA